jgi:hypothetical protein
VRLYSVAVASLALGAPAKWTDNLLAHHQIPEVRSRTRGVARGVSWAGLVRLALIRELHLALGCGVRDAVTLSARLLHASDGVVPVGPWATLGFDRRALEAQLQQRLAAALESAPRPRRGRPVSRIAAPREDRMV